MEITLFIAGVMVGWITTHLYAKSSSREQQLLFSKLSVDLKKIILDDRRDSLNITELNQLLEDKTIDKDTDDPLPFIACPKCGSPDLARSSAENPSNGDTLLTIKCTSCSWICDA